MQEILTSCSRLTVSVLQQNSLTGAQVVYLVTLQYMHKIFKLLVGEISVFSFFFYARLQRSARHSGLLSGWKLSLLLFLRQKRPLQPHIIMQCHGGSASHPATRGKKNSAFVPNTLSFTLQQRHWIKSEPSSHEWSRASHPQRVRQVRSAIPLRGKISLR